MSWLNCLRTWGGKATLSTGFFDCNPDLGFCTIHKQLTFRMPFLYEPYDPSCNQCLEQCPVSSSVNPHHSLNDAQLHWKKVYDAKGKKEQERREEAMAWINYQHHCWEVARSIRMRNPVSKEQQDILVQHVQHSLLRNREPPRYFCSEHSSLGEMLPVRSLRDYQPCTVCPFVKPKKPVLYEKVAPVTDFSL